MKCQSCNERPATVHITKIINGQKSELHLCEECAKQKRIGFSSGGLSSFIEEEGFSIGKLLSSFFDYPANIYEEKAQEKACDNCGMSFPRFTETGRFGCSRCYNEFANQMNPLLRRIHGKTYHVGKIPRRTGKQLRIKSEINRLKRELQEAVNAEEYERAAILRDKIKQINQDKSDE